MISDVIISTLCNLFNIFVHKGKHADLLYSMKCISQKSCDRKQIGKYNLKMLFKGKKHSGNQLYSLMKFRIISPIAYTKQVWLRIERGRSVNGVKQRP